MKLRLKGKILGVTSLGYVILVVIFISIIVNMIASINFQAIIRELNAYQKAAFNTIDRVYPGDFTGDDDELKKGEVLLNTSTLLEELKGEMNCEYTFFLGDERVNTTLGNGNDLIGTKADETIANRVLVYGEKISEIVKIDGKYYYAIYAPIKSTQGEVIGMLFVGKDQTLYRRILQTTVVNIILFAAVLIAVVLWNVFRFSNQMIKQINGLKQHLEAWQKGNFTMSIDETLLNQPDEIGELARSLETTQIALASLSKKNNEALQETTK